MPPENPSQPSPITQPMPQIGVNPVANQPVINSTQQINQNSQIPNSGSRLKLILIILGIIIILSLAGFGGFLYLRSQSKNSSPVISNMQSSTPQVSTQSANKQSISVNDPLKPFMNNLAAGDFQIKTSGKIVINSNETLDFTNGVFYIKKGQLVRGDYIIQNNQAITIISNNNMYNLDPVKNTYFLGNEPGQSLASSSVYALFKQTSLLLPFLDDDKNNLLVWQKTAENEYQTKWTHKFSPLESGNGQPADVKIVLNPISGSISSFSVRFVAGDPWQTVTFSYEVATAIDSLLTIPSGYTKAF